MANRLKQFLYLPPFGPLADPHLLADLAAEAEAAGWDGLFLWDHVLRRREETIDILDPWVCLAAIAVATTRIEIGCLVTPLTRRRPIKLAREVTTLDHLSRGRLKVGLGLGVDTGGELSRFDEIVDPATRGDRLDEGAEVLDALLRGKADHNGEHFTVDDVVFGPRPVQSPRPPFWFAVRTLVGRPLRRAAKYEGLLPIEVTYEQLAAMVEKVAELRGNLDNFEIITSDLAMGTGASEQQLLSIGATAITRRVEVGATGPEVSALIKNN